MRYCIPDVLFNRIPYPVSGTNDTGLDGIYREVAYKLSGAEPLVVKKEIWHSLVDFCGRTGAYLERLTNQSGVSQITLTPARGKFLRVVGAEIQAEQNGAFTPTTAFTIVEGAGALYMRFDSSPYAGAAIVSVRPPFDDETTDGGVWTPKVPQYLIDRYGECISHGALARIYAMRGDEGMARMHATAYNNDLNRLSFGLITSGMRKHLLIDVEDWLVNTSGAANGNG